MCSTTHSRLPGPDRLVKCEAAYCGNQIGVIGEGKARHDHEQEQTGVDRRPRHGRDRESVLVILSAKSTLPRVASSFVSKRCVAHPRPLTLVLSRHHIHTILSASCNISFPLLEIPFVLFYFPRGPLACRSSRSVAWTSPLAALTPLRSLYRPSFLSLVDDGSRRCVDAGVPPRFCSQWSCYAQEAAADHGTREE
jgi:hypothetical protein